MKLEGRTVFLTGAAGGIGRELIAALRRRGAARIYAADITAPRTEAGVSALALDITDPAAVAAAAAMAGDTEILINNAGVNLRAGFIASADLAPARREMEVNFFGTLAMCRAFAPVLAARGGGAIVNVLSILAKLTNPAVGTYCASKAALLRLTEGIRAELAGQGTHVLAVMPWAVDTPMSGPFPGTKTAPGEVAEGILAALERDAEEVYFHEKSDEINRRLATDPKGIERELAKILPRRG